MVRHRSAELSLALMMVAAVSKKAEHQMSLIELERRERSWREVPFLAGQAIYDACSYRFGNPYYPTLALAGPPHACSCMQSIGKLFMLRVGTPVCKISAD